MTLSEDGKIEEIVVLEDYKKKATSDTSEEKTTETLAIVTPPEEILERKAPEVEVAKDKTPQPTRRYTVQILALNKYPIAQKGYFEGLDKELIASYRGTDGYLRYVIRQFDSFAEAIAYRSEIQQSGRFSDAFIRQWAQLKALSIDSVPEATPIESAGSVKKTRSQETTLTDQPEKTRNTTSSGQPKESLKETNRSREDSPEANQHGWKYTVQVLALNKYPMPQENYLEGLEQEELDSLQGADGFLRYFTREFNSLSEAIDYRNKIQESGRFSDAFIRRYSDLEKLSTETPQEHEKQPEEKAKEKVKTDKAQPTAYKYTVQILALNKDPEPREGFFEGLDQKHITSYKGEDGYWRYIIRQFDTYSEAIAFQRKIQVSGRFKDAFIRRYSNLDEFSTDEQ
jgi:cell division septation protein DedD